MNILQVLQQLRDDIKTWVTKNFEAVDEKIDKKTFPVDSRLDSSSTNPVQNKVVTNAINNIPRFSGDYNDLTNAPNIAEDDSGEIAVTDPDGNVIFKIDDEGAHTTAMSLNGELAATEAYVDEAIKAIPTPNVSGQINVHNTSETAHEDIRKAIVDTKEELSETIESESEEWKITDDNGNTILSVDENGLNTTAVTAQTMVVNGSDVEEHILEPNIHITAEEREAWNKKSDFSGSYNDLTDVPIAADMSNYYTKDEVDEAIENVEVDLTGYATEDYVDGKVADLVDSAPEALNTLGELATALNNHEDAYDALLENVGGKATKQELADMKSELSEYIVSESEEWHIVDSNGNVVATISASGLETTTVAAQNFVINGESIEDLIKANESKSTFYVTFNEEGTSADKTVAEILEAYNAGYAIYGIFNGALIVPLTIVTEEAAMFISTFGITDVNYGMVTLNADGTVSESTITLATKNDIPTKASDVKALPDSTSLADLPEDKEHRTVTDEEKAAWNAKSDFSGSYNDLTDKPAPTPEPEAITDDEIDEICEMTLEDFLDTLAVEEVPF